MYITLEVYILYNMNIYALQDSLTLFILMEITVKHFKVTT